MKLIVAIVLTALLAFVAGMFLPWWSLAIAAVLVAVVVRQSAGRSFLAGFLGLFLLWIALAWWIDMKNGGILSKKIASLLPLGGNTFLLLLVTGLVSGLIAGFAAMSGSYLRSSKN